MTKSTAAKNTNATNASNSTNVGNKGNVDMSFTSSNDTLLVGDNSNSNNGNGNDNSEKKNPPSKNWLNIFLPIKVDGKERRLKVAGIPLDGFLEFAESQYQKGTISKSEYEGRCFIHRIIFKKIEGLDSDKNTFNLNLSGEVLSLERASESLLEISEDRIEF